MKRLDVNPLWHNSRLVDDFQAICDTGGRLAGTESEAAARKLLSSMLDELGGKRNDFTRSFTGHQPVGARCQVVETGRSLGAVALPGSPPGSYEGLGVVDLGVGSQAEFEGRESDLVGKLAVVSHEYPFTLAHTHRSKKYAWACDAGAAAFAITNNIRAIGPVTGGAGRIRNGAPAIGLSLEDGEVLRDMARRGGSVNLQVDSEERTWDATNLILDLPGRQDRYVVLCAHIDGHNLAESAMDNATGLAGVLSVARLLAPLVSELEYGLRVAFFNVEEWGLTGSRDYVESLSEEEKARIVCAVALDSITGHPRLSALTGGYAEMAELVHSYEAATGVKVDVVTPFLPNSDHANFQSAGIPAMRMIAGYGYEDSLTRYLLTGADRREIVDIGQLKAATAVVAGLVHLACSGRGPM